MELFGIGMPELIFIIIIALIVLGPKDMDKAGRTIGKFLRNVVTSDGWKLFQQTSREIKNLPTRWMREANDELGKIEKDISITDPNEPWYNKVQPPSPRPDQPPANSIPFSSSDNTIAPPREAATPPQQVADIPFPSAASPAPITDQTTSTSASSTDPSAPASGENAPASAPPDTSSETPSAPKS